MSSHQTADASRLLTEFVRNYASWALGTVDSTIAARKVKKNLFFLGHHVQSHWRKTQAKKNLPALCLFLQ